MLPVWSTSTYVFLLWATVASAKWHYWSPREQEQAEQALSRSAFSRKTTKANTNSWNRSRWDLISGMVSRMVMAWLRVYVWNRNTVTCFCWQMRAKLAEMRSRYVNQSESFIFHLSISFIYLYLASRVDVRWCKQQSSSSLQLWIAVNCKLNQCSLSKLQTVAKMMAPRMSWKTPVTGKHRLRVWHWPIKWIWKDSQIKDAIGMLWKLLGCFHDLMNNSQPAKESQMRDTYTLCQWHECCVYTHIIHGYMHIIHLKKWYKFYVYSNFKF